MSSNTRYYADLFKDNDRYPHPYKTGHIDPPTVLATDGHRLRLVQVTPEEYAVDAFSDGAPPYKLVIEGHGPDNAKDAVRINGRHLRPWLVQVKKLGAQVWRDEAAERKLELAKVRGLAPKYARVKAREDLIRKHERRHTALGQLVLDVGFDGAQLSVSALPDLPPLGLDVIRADYTRTRPRALGLSRDYLAAAIKFAGSKPIDLSLGQDDFSPVHIRFCAEVEEYLMPMRL